MNTDTMQIRMLGEFSLRCGGRELNDSDNRSRKVWLLLAYMIYCRGRTVSQEELIQLLWSEEESSSNPINALKTMFHRVRSMLDKLDPSAGHTLIIRKDGSYAWNPDVSFRFDAEEFDALCKAGAAESDGDARLEKYLQAIALYQGDFLPKLSAEPWVVPVSAYYHNLFLQVALEAVSALEQAGRHSEMVKLCRICVQVEPYSEALHQHLIRGLLALGDQRGAIGVYQSMSDLLFDTFGVMPSDESKALYREAVRTVNDREVSPGLVREQLREPVSARGALFCEYDFFKIIYQAEARAVARSGSAVHIGLLSVSGEDDRPLAKRSLDVCMSNLQSLVCSSLRKGDVASRCSVSQYIVLLPQANYENACRVMERIIRIFSRQYPHSPAVLHYSVQPLEPNL